MSDQQPPTHPGEYLRDEMVARGWDEREFGARLDWPRGLLTAVLDGRLPLSAGAASTVATVLGTSEELWTNLQAAFDKRKRSEGP